MKIKIVICFLLVSLHFIKAQVGVLMGSDLPKSTLHIGNSNSSVLDGIIAPHLTKVEIVSKDNEYGVDEKGAMVYVTTVDNTVSSPSTIYVNYIGYYVFDGKIWKRAEEEARYFHAPHFTLPLITVANGLTFDIYEEVYLKQLVKSNPALSNNFISNDSLLTATRNKVYERRELDYVITYYDAKILEINNINLDGLINYNVKSLDTEIDSFINVVFVVK